MTETLLSLIFGGLVPIGLLVALFSRFQTRPTPQDSGSTASTD